MVAWLFPGQGSQYVGMMQGLVERFPQARQRLQEAEELLGYRLGRICFEGPEELLRQTRYTQPALFVHSAIVAELVREHLQRDAVAGHSLGEYSALYAAGVLEFADALRLVALRGELMFAAGQQLPGTMAAVIGMPAQEVERLCAELAQELGRVLVVANYNSPEQVVISGEVEAVQQALERLRAAGARSVIPLPVSGAFHSPLMEPAREQLAQAIRETAFRRAQVPIYSNALAEPLTEPDAIQQALIAQLTAPVRWLQILQRMHADGVRSFYELGPGRVLQGLVKRTLTGVTIAGIDTAEDVERVRAQSVVQ
jgi:[acyl-carrier-protein] S-malonyltransferase